MERKSGSRVGLKLGYPDLEKPISFLVSINFTWGINSTERRTNLGKATEKNPEYYEKLNQNVAEFQP